MDSLHFKLLHALMTLGEPLPSNTKRSCEKKSGVMNAEVKRVMLCRDLWMENGFVREDFASASAWRKALARGPLYKPRELAPEEKTRESEVVHINILPETRSIGTQTKETSFPRKVTYSKFEFRAISGLNYTGKKRKMSVPIQVDDDVITPREILPTDDLVYPIDILDGDKSVDSEPPIPDDLPSLTGFDFTQELLPEMFDESFV